MTEWLTLDEAAEKSGRNRQGVLALLAHGYVEYTVEGPVVCVDAADLDRWVLEERPSEAAAFEGRD